MTGYGLGTYWTFLAPGNLYWVTIPFNQSFLLCLQCVTLLSVKTGAFHKRNNARRKNTRNHVFRCEEVNFGFSKCMIVILINSKNKCVVKEKERDTTNILLGVITFSM